MPLNRRAVACPDKQSVLWALVGLSTLAHGLPALDESGKSRRWIVPLGADDADCETVHCRERRRRPERRASKQAAAMAAALQATPIKTLATSRWRVEGVEARPRPRPIAVSFRCSAAARSYNITLLPGDGIGPEVVAVAKDVLSLAGALEGKLRCHPPMLALAP